MVIMHKLALDVASDGIQGNLVLVRGERGKRDIAVTLRCGKVPIVLEAGQTAVIVGVKPDGGELLNSCVVYTENGIYPNTILYHVTEGTVAAAGTFSVRLVVWDTDGNTLYSPEFSLTVKDNDALDLNVGARSEFTALIDAAAQAQRAAALAEETAEGLKDLLEEHEAEADEKYVPRVKHGNEQAELLAEDKDGEVISVPFGYGADPDSVARRQAETGALKVGDPVADDEAVTLRFADQRYLGKPEIADGHIGVWDEEKQELVDSGFSPEDIDGFALGDVKKSLAQTKESIGGLSEKIDSLSFSLGYESLDYVLKEDNVIPQNALKYAKILGVENGGAYIRKYNLFPMPYTKKAFDTFISHDDGTIEVSMKDGGNVWLLNSSSNFYVEPDVYYLSGTTTSFQRLKLIAYNIETAVASITVSGANGGAVIDLSGKTYTRLSLKLEWDSRGTVSGWDDVYPQLVKGTEGKPFEPYTIKLPCVKKIQVIRKSSGEVICEREIPAAILELSQYQAGNLLSFGDKTVGNDYVILPADETIAGELILTDYDNSLWKQTGKTVTDVSAMLGDFDPFIEIDENCEINPVTDGDEQVEEFCKIKILYQTKAVN